MNEHDHHDHDDEHDEHDDEHTDNDDVMHDMHTNTMHHAWYDAWYKGNTQRMNA